MEDQAVNDDKVNVKSQRLKDLLAKKKGLSNVFQPLKPSKSEDSQTSSEFQKNVKLIEDVEKESRTSSFDNLSNCQRSESNASSYKPTEFHDKVPSESQLTSSSNSPTAKQHPVSLRDSVQVNPQKMAQDLAGSLVPPTQMEEYQTFGKSSPQKNSSNDHKDSQEQIIVPELTGEGGTQESCEQLSIVSVCQDRRKSQIAGGLVNGGIISNSNDSFQKDESYSSADSQERIKSFYDKIILNYEKNYEILKDLDNILDSPNNYFEFNGDLQYQHHELQAFIDDCESQLIKVLKVFFQDMRQQNQKYQAKSQRALKASKGEFEQIRNDIQEMMDSLQKGLEKYGRQQQFNEGDMLRDVFQQEYMNSSLGCQKRFKIARNQLENVRQEASLPLFKGIEKTEFEVLRVQVYALLDDAFQVSKRVQTEKQEEETQPAEEIHQSQSQYQERVPNQIQGLPLNIPQNLSAIDHEESGYEENSHYSNNKSVHRVDTISTDRSTQMTVSARGNYPKQQQQQQQEAQKAQQIEEYLQQPQAQINKQVLGVNNNTLNQSVGQTSKQQNFAVKPQHRRGKSTNDGQKQGINEDILNYYKDLDQTPQAIDKLAQTHSGFSQNNNLSGINELEVIPEAQSENQIPNIPVSARLHYNNNSNNNIINNSNTTINNKLAATKTNSNNTTPNNHLKTHKRTTSQDKQDGSNSNRSRTYSPFERSRKPTTNKTNNKQTKENNTNNNSNINQGNNTNVHENSLKNNTSSTNNSSAPYSARSLSNNTKRSKTPTKTNNGSATELTGIQIKGLIKYLFKIANCHRVRVIHSEFFEKLVKSSDQSKQQQNSSSSPLELSKIGPFDYNKICECLEVIRPYNPQKFKSIVTENDKIFFIIHTKELHWMVVEVRMISRSIILYDLMDEITHSHDLLTYSNKIFDVIMLILNAEYTNKLLQGFDHTAWETVICKAPALISKSEENSLCLVLKIISNAARNHEMTQNRVGQTQINVIKKNIEKILKGNMQAFEGKPMYI